MLRMVGILNAEELPERGERGKLRFDILRRLTRSQLGALAVQDSIVLGGEETGGDATKDRS
jgi:hypothetical protein